ncbi:MAG: GNAT family N-acetyltransferase [Candidatus Aminicenantes bacterium]|nr:GNAT family N-acetyltransferase [Candidatus Aminicenantes bacterium]
MIFEIRNYSNSDFNRAAKFYVRTADGLPLSGNNCSEILIQKFSRPGYDPSLNFFIVEYKNELIGYADLVYEEQIKRAVADIFVLPPYRREGLGRDLMSCLLRRCHDLQVESLQTNIPEFDQETSSFLLKQKFSFVRYFHILERDLSKNLFLDWEFKDKDSVPDHFKSGEEEELVALQNKIFSGSWGFCPNTVEEIKYYLQMTGCRIDDVMCIEAGGRKAGYVWPHILPKDKGRIRMRIHMLGVDPEFRGKGLGKKILQMALYQIYKKETITVELTVDSENTPAVTLYKSIGFKLKSRIAWYEKPIK